MDKTVFIYVNGILNFPADSENWNGRAVTWTHLHTPHRAEKIEYYVGPISRALGQRKRARKLIRTLAFYDGWKIILVGHSNGCDVILDALSYMAWPKIHAVHLISAACEADFNSNGLNDAGDQIGSVHVWIAEWDFALKLADTYTGRFLGYGSLGRSGPLNYINAPAVKMGKCFGHSEWFSWRNFHQTMSSITGAD